MKNMTTRGMSLSLVVSLLLVSAFMLVNGVSRLEASPGDDTRTANQKEKDYVPPVPKTSGTLDLAYGNGPDTLNPILGNDTMSGSIHNRAIESFATRSFEDPSKFVPQVASSWEISKDKMKYTIHLRKNVHFHDVTTPSGETIDPGTATAYDAKFAYEVAMNPGVEAGHMRSYLQRIKSFKVLDEYTIEVTWKEPYFNAKGVTLTFLPIIPEDVYAYDENNEILSHDYSSSEFAEGFNKHWANDKLSGTGPYKLQKWDQGNQFTLTRFKDYYGQKPFMDKVVYHQKEQPITRYREFLSGNLTRVGMPQNIFINKFQGNEKRKKGKLVEEKYDFPSYRYIGWNIRKSLFEDKKVRQAMTHTIPRKEIIEEVLHGMARVTTGPFFFKREAYNHELEPYEYNIEKARSLLDEAGWKDRDGDGIREKKIDGETQKFEFILLHYADSPTYRQIGKIVSSRMEKIGVKVQPAPTKWNSFLTKVQNRNFDACLLGWAMGYASDPYQVWHSSQAGAKGGSNHVGWTDDTTDQLIEKIRKTMDREKRLEMYHRFHKILHENQPYTFLWTSKELAGHHSKLHGVGEEGPSQIRHYALRPGFDMHEWFYAAEEQSPEKRKAYWENFHEKRSQGEVVPMKDPSSLTSKQTKKKDQSDSGGNMLIVLAAGGIFLVLMFFAIKRILG